MFIQSFDIVQLSKCRDLVVLLSGISLCRVEILSSSALSNQFYCITLKIYVSGHELGKCIRFIGCLVFDPIALLHTLLSEHLSLVSIRRAGLPLNTKKKLFIKPLKPTYGGFSRRYTPLTIRAGDEFQKRLFVPPLINQIMPGAAVNPH